MKTTILFVDDDQNIIHGLKRMLYTKRREWKLLFASNGNEAINIISEQHVDIIVSDMRMPKMNGIELLNYIKVHYPHIIRIILSGYSDKEMILRSATTVHQFLAKPCDADTLIQTINKAYSLHKLIKNENLAKKISGMARLPSLPSLYYKIEERMQCNNVSLKEIGDLIAQDVAMTAKVLQLVNSAFFCLRKRVTSPQQAAIILGVNTLKMLVLYVHVFKSLKDLPQPYFDNFVKHSVTVSKLSKEIARTEFKDSHLVDEACTAGLLHDIGKLILMQVPEYYNNIEKLVYKKGCSYTEAEYEIFQTTHAEVGAYLLGQWGIPDSIIEVSAYHNHVSNFKGTKVSSLTIVHVANGLLTKKSISNQITYPKIDMDYLESLNLIDKFNDWESIANNLINNFEL